MNEKRSFCRPGLVIKKQILTERMQKEILRSESLSVELEVSYQTIEYIQKQLGLMEGQPNPSIEKKQGPVLPRPLDDTCSVEPRREMNVGVGMTDPSTDIV